MIALIQRVSHASVDVNNEQVGQIDQGILALIGIEKTDTHKQANRLLERILAYRIFPDPDDRMNLSLTDIQGGLLLVPQFTLVADTRKGNRPSFTSAASPELGKQQFNYLMDRAEAQHPHVAGGIFGADMQVTLLNDGPVTFLLQVNT
ncbi:MAG: D-tyrosyl-tRNA(Tyr) deacylase [Gammaproteobacteria bacterium]|nr:MAG: D-tyrosyl-tRNA(Tyr) deacylase [Gammaproteobacteria bacterium]